MPVLPVGPGRQRQVDLHRHHYRRHGRLRQDRLHRHLHRQPFDQHPTDLADLQGARLVTAIETAQGKNWNETRIKTLTGGDRIKARYMAQDFFEYTPQFKLLIAGNNKPGLTGRRGLPPPLSHDPIHHRIPPEKRISAFQERLQERMARHPDMDDRRRGAVAAVGLAPPATVLRRQRSISTPRTPSARGSRNAPSSIPAPT